MKTEIYMYEIEHTEYGLQLTIEGTPSGTEAAELAAEVRSAVENISGSFHILVDLRRLDIYTEEAASEMTDLMGFCKRNGLDRSASVVGSTTSEMQISRLVDAAGADERVINENQVDDWEETALQWIEDGVES